MSEGTPPRSLLLRRAFSPLRPPRRRGPSPQRALRALLCDPRRLHALCRQVLALPLGPRDLPLLAAPTPSPWGAAGASGGADLGLGAAGAALAACDDAPLLWRLPPPARPPWLLLEILSRRSAGRPRWARPWLAALRRTGQAGWLVLLTDSDDVLRWARARPLRARYGPELEPRVVHLGRERERLLCPAAPLLAPLALWAARRWPAEERALLLGRALRLAQGLAPPERAREIALLLELFQPGPAIH